MSLAVGPGSPPPLLLVRQKAGMTDPAMLQAAQEEIDATRRMRATELLPIQEVTLEPNKAIIAYPWRDGLPLAVALARAREAVVLPPMPVAGRLVLDALAALGTLHGHLDDAGAPKPLVHGCFRADSLWLGFDGRAVLADGGYCAVRGRL